MDVWMQIVHGCLNGTSRNTDAPGKKVYLCCCTFFFWVRHSDGSAFTTKWNVLSHFESWYSKSLSERHLPNGQPGPSHAVGQATTHAVRGVVGSMWHAFWVSQHNRLKRTCFFIPGEFFKYKKNEPKCCTCQEAPQNPCILTRARSEGEPG